MSHRSVAAIPLNGLEPGGTPRSPPIFEWVKPETLLIDASYQRDLSERSLKLIRKIVAGWDWSKFKAPIAVMTEAGLELIDGQCTSIAAATHPDVPEIPVMVVDVKEHAERAAAFIGHNRDRVAVTAPQLHVAAVAAGDPEAQAIDRVCTAAGVTVLRVQPSTFKPRTTIAVNALRTLVKRTSEENATRVMSCLARAELAPITQAQIKAADMLLNDPEYAGQISEDALVTTIGATAAKADQEAAVFCAAHPSTPVWKALGIVWFKARRVKAQPPAAPAHSKPTPRPVASTGTDRDSRPERDGWIPGVYARFCAECDQTYKGDKKSLKCADCAYDKVPA